MWLGIQVVWDAEGQGACGWWDQGDAWGLHLCGGVWGAGMSWGVEVRFM